MTKEYDLVILGGGIGGYTAAIRASQLGMHVAIVEKDKLGGTCLHKGCVPSKVLLRSAEIYRLTKEADTFGIDVKQSTLKFPEVQNRKKSVIQTLYQGIQSLMKKNKIDIYQGRGRMLGPSIFSPLPGTISIEHDDGKENTILTPKYVLLATGAKPKRLPDLPVDEPFILTSDEALELKELPQSMIIVGGGVIGIEWASMMIDMGVEVTVIETAATILPHLDETIANEAKHLLSKKGVRFFVKANFNPEKVTVNNSLVEINVETKDSSQIVRAEKLLLAIGREANVNEIGIENTNIELEHGFIRVNEYFQTKESHIYAVGDVIGGKQLAHLAAYEGMVAVEHMANQQPYPIEDNQVPVAVYSHPEIASVGLTEAQAKQLGTDIEIGIFPFQANGKAIILGESAGLVKIIANKDTNDVLGVHMIGPDVTELISEAGLAQVLQATPWEMALNIHPHPSLSETIGEAAMAVNNRQIHY